MLVPADRPSRFWFVLPALLLLAVVVMLQRRRIAHLAKVAVALSGAPIEGQVTAQISPPRQFEIRRAAESLCDAGR